MTLLPARNFAFGGCGWMMGYHLGVMTQLHRRQALDFARGSRIATASGGAVVGACFASGVAKQDMEDAIVRFNEDNRAGGLTTWYLQLDRVIGDALRELLPEDCHERVAGKLIVSTRVIDGPEAQRGPVFHDAFTSKEDLIQAVVASSYIPLFTGAGRGFSYKGALHVDGASTGLCPDPAAYVEVSIRGNRMVKGKAPISQDAGFLPTLVQMATPQLRGNVYLSVARGVADADAWVDANEELVVRAPGVGLV